MDEFSQKLTEIMHKIAFKVPWQRLKLNEDELRVLDEATGEQMVDIAYKNRIPFSRFIHHADELINEFNEHKFKQYLKDVKELNKALEEPFKCAVTRDIQIEPVIENDPSARERELMAAAIQEFLDGRLSDEHMPRSCSQASDSPNLKQMENFLGRFQNARMDVSQAQNAPKESEAMSKTLEFVGGINSHNTLGGSISLQRHAQEPSNYHLNMNFGEDLPMPSLDELAEIGLLEGESGRKIFNNIVEQENRDQNEIRRTDEMAPPLEVTPIVPANVPDIEIAVEHLTLQPGQVEPPKEISTVEQQQSILPDIELPPPVEAVPVERAKSPQEVESRPSTRESYAERIARLEKVPDININQLGAQQNTPQKPKRKARVRRIKQAVEDLEIVPHLKPLILKQQKKMPKKKKNPNRVDVYALNLELNFIDEVKNNLIEYDIPPAECIEEAISVIPELSVKTQDVPMEEKQETSAHQKRAITSPEIENVSKRPRLARKQEVSIEIPSLELPSVSEQQKDPSEQIIPQIEEIPPVETSIQPQQVDQPPQIDATIPELPTLEPSVPVPQISSSFDPSIDLAVREAVDKNPVQIIEQPNIGTSLQQSNASSDPSFKTPLPKKQGTSAILHLSNKFSESLKLDQKKLSGTITMRDILYAGLVKPRESVVLATPQPVDMTPIEPIEPTQCQHFMRQMHPQKELEYKKFKDPFSGIEKMEFKNKQGKEVVYEEINIQNMLLYMQIRKYMKMHKKTSLVAEEFKKHLKLPHTKKDFVLVNRLTQLIEKGLLEGVWNEDPTALMADVLFEIKLPQKEQDKENVP